MREHSVVMHRHMAAVRPCSASLRLQIDPLCMQYETTCPNFASLRLHIEAMCLHVMVMCPYMLVLCMHVDANVPPHAGLVRKRHACCLAWHRRVTQTAKAVACMHPVLHAQGGRFAGTWRRCFPSRRTV